MHPRIQELLTYLDDRRAELRAAVDGVPEDRRERPPAPGRWSVAGVLEHLAIVEARIDALFKKKIAEARAAGIGADTETSSMISDEDTAMLLDRTRILNAPDALQPKAEATAADAWRALEQARATFRSTVLDADGLALTEIWHPHLAFGPMNFYKWIAFLGGHEARHAAQIREIGAQLSDAPS